MSQNPDSFYLRYHDLMNRFRGSEAGRKLAEGFVRHVQSADESLLLALQAVAPHGDVKVDRGR